MSSLTVTKIQNLFHHCEFLGSMFLVIVAVSPTILFHEIFETNVAITVLADAIAIGFVLYALIEIFSPVCTSFFNPAVTFALTLDKKLTWKQFLVYSFNQVLGGIFGVLISHLMFYNKIPKLFELSTIARSGGSYIAEIVGTFFLILAIFSLTEQKSNKTAQIIGFLVAGMLLATSSTMFANPQVTLARIFTYSIAGISLFDAGVFIIMQVIGGAFAIFVWRHMKTNCSDFKGSSCNT